MAIYRSVQMSFWTDSKVVDDFTPEDRDFYLYLMTNPHTNLAGCYEVSIKQVSDETGYSKETVNRLLDRMEKVHDVIRYSPETKEVLILNWSKYNWTKSKDFQKPLLAEIESVKNFDFKAYLQGDIDRLNTVPTGSKESPETTVTVTVSDTVNKDTVIIKEIVSYLNEKAEKNFRPSSKETQKHIRARLKDGYTIDDFKRVIDNKCSQWKGDKKMDEFLRPKTLFTPENFESYLNQKMPGHKQDIMAMAAEMEEEMEAKYG